ncbi:MAG: hypothetical protein JO270_18130 [Acidobacteriaceae bacterium]|nr:hypothetical protein [Acidobacteriaceae bacterium]
MSLPATARPDLNSAKRRPNWKKRFLQIAAPLLFLYCAALAGFDYAMHQPPETFARVMMHTGPAPFLLFPFETMWRSARAGSLGVGDAAPDFTLPLLDHSGVVTLSSLRGARPVVLIFGSYT